MRRRVLALALLPVVALLGAAAVRAAPEGTPPPAGPADLALYAAVLPDQRDAVVAATAGRLPVYAIEATLTPATATAPATVAGTLRLRFVNAGGAPLPELYLRLYANDARYAEGAIALDDATVDGAPVAPELSVDDTVARVPLPHPLPPGGATELDLAFATTVPTAPRGTYGLFAVEPEAGTHALAHWFPLLAGRDPAGGWNLEPPTAWGDVIFSDTALFDVALTAPRGLVVVASGSQVEEAATGDAVRRRYVTGPARDVTVVADDDLVAVAQEVGGTRVVSHHEPEDEAAGAAALAYGAQALAVFNDLFGPYPYAELDLVEVPLTGDFVGAEFPQLILLDAALYGDTVAAGFGPDALEATAAHEVAHQWWYGLVGNDQYAHAFLDEGLAEIARGLYFERQHGRAPPAPPAAPTSTAVDRPTADFPDAAAYFATVYDAATRAFAALRAEIGDEAFLAGLRDYAEQWRFAVAGPDELRAAFARAAGRDLTEFWRRWFEGGGEEQAVRAAASR